MSHFVPRATAQGDSDASHRHDEAHGDRAPVHGGHGLPDGGAAVPPEEARRRKRGAPRDGRASTSTLTVEELSALRPVELAIVGADGRIEFRIQRELRNDNAANRNPHWSKKHAKRQLWLRSLTNALVIAIGYDRARDLLVPESGLFGARGLRVQERRRLEILRLVPSRRHFVKDTFENLPWCAKELRDAIKYTGLIRDDSDRWTLTTIDQDLSQDGRSWTWIAIAPFTLEGA